MPSNALFVRALTMAGCVALTMVGRGIAAPEDVPDVESIRQELKQSWESLQSIQFRADEYGIDAEGHRTTEYAIRVDFAHAKGGRWAYASRSTRGEDVKELAADFREDGKTQRTISAFPGHPEMINNIVVRSQADDDKTYSGGMQEILWLWLPGGKPPIAHLDAGGRLEVTKVDGKVHAVIHSTHKGSPIQIELDPDHDWLPRRVTFDEFQEFEAKTFRRDNGRWFYEEGRQRKHHGSLTGPEAGEIVATPKGDTRRGFVVTSLSINRPIDTATFAAPKGGVGVLIQDETTGKDDILGGTSAYRDRVLKYGPKPATKGSASPVTASIDPPGDPWGRSILVASAAAMVTAGFLVIRRSRKRN
jgi:hypothetical protein